MTIFLFSAGFFLSAYLVHRETQSKLDLVAKRNPRLALKLKCRKSYSDKSLDLECLTAPPYPDFSPQINKERAVLLDDSSASKVKLTIITSSGPQIPNTHYEEDVEEYLLKS